VKRIARLPLAAALLAACAPAGGERPSGRAREVADYAVRAYADSAVVRLAQLVAFRTVAREGVPNVENPAFRALRDYLARVAGEFGRDFTDHGSEWRRGEATRLRSQAGALTRYHG
jgi:hypothetical protein